MSSNVANYPDQVLDLHFKEIKESLGRIETQVNKTNGRVTKLEEATESMDRQNEREFGKIWRALLVVGCVTGTVLILKGNELIHFIKAII